MSQNYDGLLYRALMARDLMNGNNGRLVDGLLDSGFESSNLDPHPGKTFGWYLHLHGSPLFYDDPSDQTTRKLHIPKLPSMDKSTRKHLVLTSFDLKADVISGSHLLDTYWDYFLRAIRTSDRLVLIGYKGKDKHVNNAIKETVSHTSTPEVVVIEWEGEGQGRDEYWRGQLGIKPKYLSFFNILDFDWKV